MLLPLLLLACFGTSSDPCQDYCDYICDCHAGESGYDCDSCRTEYATTDAELQDECETTLIDLQDEDDAAGHTCAADTGGR
jgi:hypothetical protein